MCLDILLFDPSTLSCQSWTLFPEIKSQNSWSCDRNPLLSECSGEGYWGGLVQPLGIWSCLIFASLLQRLITISVTQTWVWVLALLPPVWPSGCLSVSCKLHFFSSEGIVRWCPLRVSYLLAVIAQDEIWKWEEVARYESSAPEG